MKFRSTFQIVVAMLATLGLSGVLAAQEGPRSQYEHVKGLEPFIGFWVAEGEDEQEGPRLAVSCRWAANKSYGQFSIWGRSGEERMHFGTINVGWDGSQKALAMWAFFPDGQSHARASVDGGTLKWSSQGTTAEGEKMSADVTFVVDGDTLNIQVRNSRRGDEPRPDMDITLKRRQRDGQ